jgi:DNA-binding beta-propeller fold protein YncE
MLTTIRRLGLISIALPIAACFLLVVAACSRGGISPNGAPALQRNLPASESDQSAPKKIYILNASRLRTFTEDGTPTSPTITDGLTNACGVAVDGNGKTYVANAGGKSGTVTTYDPSGRRTQPTIAVHDYRPCAVTVDANGKIYVSGIGGGKAPNVLTSYSADGSRVRLTKSRPCARCT